MAEFLFSFAKVAVFLLGGIVVVMMCFVGLAAAAAVSLFLAVGLGVLIVAFFIVALAYWLDAQS